MQGVRDQRLTIKQLETPGCIPSTVANVSLVLKHHAFRIHNADKICIVFGPILNPDFTFTENKPRKHNSILKKMIQLFEG